MIIVEHIQNTLTKHKILSATHIISYHIISIRILCYIAGDMLATLSAQQNEATLWRVALFLYDSFANMPPFCALFI